jgi:hypothetical protein
MYVCMYGCISSTPVEPVGAVGIFYILSVFIYVYTYEPVKGPYWIDISICIYICMNMYICMGA